MYRPPPTRRFVIGTLHQVQLRSGMAVRVAAVRSGLGVDDDVMRGIVSERFVVCQ